MKIEEMAFPGEKSFVAESFDSSKDSFLLILVINREFTAAFSAKKKSVRKILNKREFDPNRKGDFLSPRSGFIRKQLNADWEKISSFGLVTTAKVFMSDNPFELCNKVKLIKQGTKTGTDVEIYEDEIAALIDQLSEQM